MNKPIGIFDSGLGGLTVMAEVMRLLPKEDIVYFGDTARVPYGSKSSETVTRYSLDIADFLISKKVKMIVVACNTASAFALPALRKKFKVPVIGVIAPGAKAALNATKTGRIGVIGTLGTVKSLSYPTAINSIDPKARVFAAPCPLFVPLVEEGWLDHPVTARVAEEYLKDLKKKNIDTLVLGCTHYPLIKRILQKVVGNRIRLIDSASSTAIEVADTLKRLDMISEANKPGKHSFYVSDMPQKFGEVGKQFLGRPIRPVKKISLDD